MIWGNTDISPGTMATVFGYLAQYSRVCAKLLDSDGNVVAINKAGLEILGRDAEEICGKHWVSLWEGADRDIVAQAVDECFDGTASRVVANAVGETGLTTWDIEAFPCDWDNGAVTRILVISTPVIENTAQADAMNSKDIATGLSQALHAVANLSNTATSAANLLRRGLPADRIEEMARSLEQSGLTAKNAVADLRQLIDRA